MLTLVDESEVKTVSKKKDSKKKEKDEINKQIDNAINASKIVHIDKLTEHL